MGLGKTIQAIAFLLHLQQNGHLCDPALIVVPLSIVQNWSDEIARFGPSLKCCVYAGDQEERARRQEEIASHREMNIVITTYEMCVKDVAFVERMRWSILIIDEAQRIKNHKSLLYRSLLPLPVRFRLLMTGTPVQNNLVELGALLKFLHPELFTESPKTFAKWFTPPKHADHGDVREWTRQLQEHIAPFLLRREIDVALKDLPIKKEVHDFSVGISALQKKLYKSILTKDVEAFQNGHQNALNNILMQLRKCVDHPYLFHGIEPEPFQLGDHLVDASGKLWLLDRLLKQLHEQHHRVLIFSQLTSMLDILQDYLYYRKYTYERLDGSVRGDERYLAIENFAKMEDTFIFLLSTRAGGVGLNLVQADVVIFFDSDFNPQMDLQAAARVHRIGQTKPVLIIRLVASGTAEEVILRRADRKRRLAERIFGGHRFSQLEETSTEVEKEVDELKSVLKYGLDDIIGNEDSTIVEQDLKSILAFDETPTTIATGEPLVQLEKEETDDNIYAYAGKDYSKELKAKDDEAFANLAEAAKVDVADQTRKRKPPVSLDIGSATTPKIATGHRKARPAITKEERWKKHGYVSHKLELDVIDQLDNPESELLFRKGSVTEPEIVDGTDLQVIVHCVDPSGEWSDRGVFRALSALSPQIEKAYALAARMKDLHLGDVHVFDVENPDIRVALLVAYKRDPDGRVQFRMESFRHGLSQLGTFAVEQRASLHFPRFGLKLEDWYPVERSIRNEVVARGASAVVYYHKRSSTSTKTAATVRPPVSQESEKPATSKQSVSSRFPNLFGNYTMYVYASEDENAAKEKHQLERYIVAYGGNLAASAEQGFPVIVLNGTTFEESDRGMLRGKLLLRPQWITESIKQNKLMDIQLYICQSC